MSDLWRQFRSRIVAYDREAIPKPVRREVWKSKFGDNDHGECYCCGCLVWRDNRGWHCSHIISYRRGGRNVVENLRVCCEKCNLKMKTHNLYDYVEKHPELNGEAKRDLHFSLERWVMRKVWHDSL